MTRSEPTQRIALHQPHLTERDVKIAVKMLLEQMAACLADGGRIEIRGVGSFSLRFRAARIGRNPYSMMRRTARSRVMRSRSATLTVCPRER